MNRSSITGVDMMQMMLDQQAMMAPPNGAPAAGNSRGDAIATPIGGKP